MEFIFAIAILIMSVVLHEVSHGYAAYAMGDSTAKYAGRLTLNPFKHLDLFGSIILPVLTYLSSHAILGWAKPVPFNPYNLKNQKWGPAVVGIAGPAMNFLLVLFFGIFIRLGNSLILLPASLIEISALIAIVNLQLMILNLIPIPPLDGSKLLFAVLPYRWRNFEYTLERYGFFILIIFIMFLGFGRIILPISSFLFKLITGLAI